MERFASDLAEALRSHPELLVRSFVAGGSAVAEPPRWGIVEKIKSFGLYPIAVRRLGGDVFHVIDHGYAHLLLGLPARRTVVTCHDLMALEAAELGAADYGSTRLARTRLRASLRLLRRAGHVACDSVATQESVLRLARTTVARTSVVPLGVHPRFAPTSAEQRERFRRRIAPGRDLLFTVCTGGSYKNVSTTIRVLRRLHDGDRRAVLARVGRPMSDAERLLATQLRVEGSIIELGTVADADLVLAYGAADVLLFPSLHEGFGWPVLESMACGTPVVTSDIPVLRQTSGGAALECAPNDVEGLAAAVCSLLDDPVRWQEQRERGLKRAASFSWTRTADRYAEIYGKLAAGDAGSAR